MDLALPSDVPLADLLPTLLRYAGEDLADEGVRHGGWALSRLGGQPLDGGRTAAQLGVRDGEVLYFNPRAATAPEIVFDDVVDAVATSTTQRGGRLAGGHHAGVRGPPGRLRACRRRGGGAVHRPAAPARRGGRLRGRGGAAGRRRGAVPGGRRQSHRRGAGPGRDRLRGRRRPAGAHR
ncbi:EsaB/YukD family protein [Micromonospora sp. M42]|uniref:EsaB/YukD family protein n=1 Tax=Micromonospora sp. M42 TaxID=457406 RepID=UPI00350FCAB7